jgi:hypothetical protein
VKPDVDWDVMSNDEIRELMDDGREEIENRISLLTEAMNGRPKGPGRPKNGASRLTATDHEKDATST